MLKTATAINPTRAYASEEPATLLATASTETGKQTQTEQTPPPAAAEKPATETTKPGETPAAAAAEKPAEGSEKAAEKPAAAAVPEKYEFKAPEGTEYDPEILESFSGAAKEAGLSQDAAQKLIEKMAPALAARQVDQVKAIHKEWQDTSTADAEFGGKDLPANLGVARKALDTFGTPELRKLLDDTGLGNHPEVIRLLYRTGKAISEDKFVAGSPRGNAAANPAAVLYDKTPAAK